VNTAGPFTFTPPDYENMNSFAFFGDWDAISGLDTLNSLLDMQRQDRKSTQMILFLGDFAYDLYTNNYTRGEQ